MLPSTQNVPSRTSHLKAGPLAGGIVGGLLVIALLLLGWYFWKHKRATAIQRAEQQLSDPEQYIIPVSQSGPTTISHSAGVNSREIFIPPARTLDSTIGNSTSQQGIPIRENNVGTLSEGSASLHQFQAKIPIHENDGGILLENALLPPAYSSCSQS